ncbi:FtsX-like permease family protein [Jatrophihabitans sp.]|uniref:ABC transporter permease n=1 Tax=Jatrophihabitans sp. TaxID=1932789 RepID=UPI00391719DE
MPAPPGPGTFHLAVASFGRRNRYVTILRAWLRLELRRRWRTLAALSLLVGLASGTVFAAVAGARRGASAQSRLQDRTRPATATVYANDPNFDWGRVRALPGVEALGTFVVTYGTALEGLPDGLIAFPPADDAEMRTIERPVVFHGRVPDPTRADEAVVTPKFASIHHKGVGDTVVLRLPTPAQVADGEATDHARLAGPRVTLHIVGVVRSPWLAVDTPDNEGTLIPSAGLTAAFRPNLVGGGAGAEYINAIVRLRGGESAVSAFRDAATRIRPDLEVVSLPSEHRQVQRASAFEARCLLAFAAAALIAALFLVGAAIVRYSSAGATELLTLRPLGMTPQQRIVAAATAAAVAGVVGAAVGAVGAVLASRWFPLGTAKLLEPSPGIDIDWTVLGPGFAFVAIAVLGAAVIAARVAVTSASRDTAGRRSTVARTAARAGLPVPLVVGVRFALEPGRGQFAVPVRPALIGAVAGVLGILASLTFASAVSDAAGNPERFGQSFQLVAYVGLSNEDFGPIGPVYAVLSKDPNVETVNDVKLGVATARGGHTSVSVYADRPVGSALPIVITSGRAAGSADEVVLAPRSGAALHAGIGDTVSLTGDRGAVRLHVTGIGFVPQGPHNSYADGAWMSPAGYRTLFKGFQYHEALVSLRPGVKPSVAATALVKAVLTAIPEAEGFEFDFAYDPPQVAQIRQVRVLPVVLGSFLGLLAIGAIGHALATAVRRRSHDLAVLRALGMTPRQSFGVITAQATVLAAVGLVFGVPLGIALGRFVWRAVADSTPLQYAPPPAALALASIAPAALVVVNLLAAWPGRRAAGMRITDILRTE